MESTAFFEKKISLTPKDLNKLKTTTIEELLLEKAREIVESKCSEQGFVLPGSVKVISRSMGYFEPARFTGDAVYYVKLEGQVVYPVDGVRVIGEVIRKNKMGLYVIYKDAVRIQVPRDLHLGNEEYEQVAVGDNVEVELKRSKFQINDPYILASGLFVANKTNSRLETISEEEEESKNEELEEEEEDEEEELEEDEDEAETNINVNNLL